MRTSTRKKMKKKRLLYIAAACLLIAFGVIPFVVTMHSGSTVKMVLFNDGGAELNRFFDGVTETDARTARLNSRWTVLTNWAQARAAKITSHRIFHYLGLAPMTVYAQSSCSGDYQAPGPTRKCASGCPDNSTWYPLVQSGCNPCQGWQNTATPVCTNSGCAGCPVTLYGTTACQIPNCGGAAGKAVVVISAGAGAVLAPLTARVAMLSEPVQELSRRSSSICDPSPRF